MRIILLIALSFPVCVNLQAQIGGSRTYEFLNIPHTALLTGLGGVNVSNADEDVNLLFSNPALIGNELSGIFSANYQAYFSDIGLSSFAYARHFEDKGVFGIGMQHLALGDIESYDPTGSPMGKTSSGESSIAIAYNRQSNNFRFGGTLKFVNSNVAGFHSSAVMFDIGGVFIHPEKDLNVGLVFKNLGFVLNEYSETSESVLPFDVQLGVTFKPMHMPFRFNLTAYNLYKMDIAYYEPDNNLQDGEPGIFDKAIRHFVIGTELIISKNVNLRAGYNHLIRKELRLEETAGGAGFSYGFIIKVKAFELAYAHGGYHVAGGTNNFTLSTNIDNMMGIGRKTNGE